MNFQVILAILEAHNYNSLLVWLTFRSTNARIILIDPLPKYKDKFHGNMVNFLNVKCPFVSH